jgi:hypothetical protein
MYIFIREDLSQAQKIVQASHAALEAGFVYDQPNGSTHIVLIGAKNQEALLGVRQHLENCGIDFQIFHEPDYDTGYTAIATKPLYGDERLPLKKYSLFRS